MSHTRAPEGGKQDESFIQRQGGHLEVGGNKLKHTQDFILNNQNNFQIESGAAASSSYGRPYFFSYASLGSRIIDSGLFQTYRITKAQILIYPYQVTGTGPTPPTSPTCCHAVHTPGTPTPVVQGASTSLISGILLSHNPSIFRQNSIPVPPQSPKCSKSQTNSPSMLLALLEQDLPQEMQEKCIPAIPFPLPTRSGWMQATCTRSTSSPPPVKRSKLISTSSSKSPSSSTDSIGSQDIPKQARAYHWAITLFPNLCATELTHLNSFQKPQ